MELVPVELDASRSWRLVEEECGEEVVSVSAAQWVSENGVESELVAILTLRRLVVWSWRGEEAAEVGGLRFGPEHRVREDSCVSWSEDGSILAVANGKRSRFFRCDYFIVDEEPEVELVHITSVQTVSSIVRLFPGPFRSGDNATHDDNGLLALVRSAAWWHRDDGEELDKLFWAIDASGRLIDPSQGAPRSDTSEDKHDVRQGGTQSKLSLLAAAKDKVVAAAETQCHVYEARLHSAGPNAALVAAWTSRGLVLTLLGPSSQWLLEHAPRIIGSAQTPPDKSTAIALRLHSPLPRLRALCAAMTCESNQICVHALEASSLEARLKISSTRHLSTLEVPQRDGMAFAPNFDSLAIAGKERIQVWNARTGIKWLDDEPTSERSCVAWTLGGSTLIVVDCLEGKAAPRRFGRLEPCRSRFRHTTALCCAEQSLFMRDVHTTAWRRLHAEGLASPLRRCVALRKDRVLLAGARGLAVVSCRFDQEEITVVDARARARDIIAFHQDKALVLLDHENEGYDHEEKQHSYFRVYSFDSMKVSRIQKAPLTVDCVLDALPFLENTASSSGWLACVVTMLQGLALLQCTGNSSIDVILEEPQLSARAARLVPGIKQVCLLTDKDSVLLLDWSVDDAVVLKRFTLDSSETSLLRNVQAIELSQVPLLLVFKSDGTILSGWNWVDYTSESARSRKPKVSLITEHSVGFLAATTPGLEGALIVAPAEQAMTTPSARLVPAAAAARLQCGVIEAVACGGEETSVAASRGVVQTMLKESANELATTFSRQWIIDALVLSLRDACARSDAFLETRCLLGLAASLSLPCFLSVIGRAGRPMTEDQLERLFFTFSDVHSWRKKLRYRLPDGTLRKNPSAMFSDCLRLGDRRLAADFLSLVAFQDFRNGTKHCVLTAARRLLRACFDARLYDIEVNAASYDGQHPDEDLLSQAWAFARRTEAAAVVHLEEADDDQLLSQEASTDELAAGFALSALLEQHQALARVGAALVELGWSPPLDFSIPARRALLDPNDVAEACLTSFPDLFTLQKNGFSSKVQHADALYAVARVFDLDAWRLVLSAALDRLHQDDLDRGPRRRGLAARLTIAFKKCAKDKKIALLRPDFLNRLNDVAGQDANSAGKHFVV